MKTIAISVLLALTLGACGSNQTGKTGSSLAAEPGSSTYLADAGENAKTYFYELIEKSGLTVVDARDPRLYPNGGPFQPPTPADRAVIQVGSNGAFRIHALILDRPGYLEVKEFPTGNFVLAIAYGVERVAYSSRFDGLYASVTRNTSGYGWNYVYYLRGYGNAVTPAGFDVAVARFLENGATYVSRL